VFEDIEKLKSKKQPKKITKQRLKNIALYYLKRFDSSVSNLRQILKKRVSEYAYYNSEWNKNEALEWIEQLLVEFENYGYLDDNRYAEIKVKNYAIQGKSPRYILGHLKMKGIGESVVEDVLTDIAYNQFDAALKLAKKKKIGPFREKEISKDMKTKDMAILLRAGFDYDVVQNVLNYEV